MKYPGTAGASAFGATGLGAGALSFGGTTTTASTGKKGH